MPQRKPYFKDSVALPGKGKELDIAYSKNAMSPQYCSRQVASKRTALVSTVSESRVSISEQPEDNTRASAFEISLPAKIMSHQQHRIAVKRPCVHLTIYTRHHTSLA